LTLTTSRWWWFARTNAGCCARREGFEGQEHITGRRGWRASGRLARVGRAGGAGRNVVNPRVGNALQHTRPDREEETGEVVQNHEVGTRMGRRGLIPKEVGYRATGGRLPGVDSLASNTTEGRSLDNPMRGCSDDRAGSARIGQPRRERAGIQTGVRAAGPGRVGKAGVKVRRVKRASPTRTCAPETMVPRRQTQRQPSV